MSASLEDLFREVEQKIADYEKEAVSEHHLSETRHDYAAYAAYLRLRHEKARAAMARKLPRRAKAHLMQARRLPAWVLVY